MGPGVPGPQRGPWACRVTAAKWPSCVFPAPSHPIASSSWRLKILTKCSEGNRNRNCKPEATLLAFSNQTPSLKHPGAALGPRQGPDTAPTPRADVRHVGAGAEAATSSSGFRVPPPSAPGPRPLPPPPLSSIPPSPRTCLPQHPRCPVLRCSGQ